MASKLFSDQSLSVWVGIVHLSSGLVGGESAEKALMIDDVEVKKSVQQILLMV